MNESRRLFFSGGLEHINFYDDCMSLLIITRKNQDDSEMKNQNNFKSMLIHLIFILLLNLCSSNFYFVR